MWDQAEESASLTGSQVTLILLVQGPHFEDPFLCTCGSQPYMIIRITRGTQMNKQAMFRLHSDQWYPNFWGWAWTFKNYPLGILMYSYHWKPLHSSEALHFRGITREDGSMNGLHAIENHPCHRNQYLFKHRMWKCFYSCPPNPNIMPLRTPQTLKGKNPYHGLYEPVWCHPSSLSSHPFFWPP